MKKHLFVLLGAIACGGCIKKQPEGPLKQELLPGRVMVNEMVSSGSAQRNEFEEYADWVELYNPGARIELEAGAWFVTDDVEHEPLKFELPAIELPEGGSLVIWCDGHDGVADGIHTNFSLSGNDGSFALLHVGANGASVIDEVEIIAHEAGDASFGRYPDGTAAWVRLGHPTPGSSNKPMSDQR